MSQARPINCESRARAGVGAPGIEAPTAMKIFSRAKVDRLIAGRARARVPDFSAGRGDPRVCVCVCACGRMGGRRGRRVDRCPWIASFNLRRPSSSSSCGHTRDGFIFFRPRGLLIFPVSFIFFLFVSLLLFYGNGGAQGLVTGARYSLRINRRGQSPDVISPAHVDRGYIIFKDQRII
jgi:hypothetical protein